MHKHMHVSLHTFYTYIQYIFIYIFTHICTNFPVYTNIPFIGYVKCQIGLRNLFLTENDPTLNYFSQLICHPEFSSTTKQFRYQLQYFKEEYIQCL